MIKAWVQVGETELKGGPWIFDALPALGMTIRIRDEVGFKHNLEVSAVELEGMGEADWLKARDVGVDLMVTLFCKAD